MSKQRTEEGFPHSPDPIRGVDTVIRRDGQTGDVTVSFGDGSDDLKVDRREFMRISGVAAAAAAMAGSACRGPVEKIVPYVDRPEEIRVGMPNYYASVCDACPANCGTLVQTRAGRPIKLEGNPRHPTSQGALCARGQSSYLDLYDPDRARAPKSGGADTTWAELDKAVVAAIGSAKGVRLLTGTVNGSARLGLINAVRAATTGFRHHQFDALNNDAMIAAAQSCYGLPQIPHYRFDQADIVVSLGSDFLGTWLSPVEFTKQFSARRDPDGKMNRLVAFEGNLSLTGMRADDRHLVRPSDLHLVAMALANVVIAGRKEGSMARDASILAAVSKFTPEEVSKRTGIEARVFEDLGTELAAHAGRCLIVAGGSASAQASGIALETAVNLLNATLGSDGVTIERGRTSMQSRGSAGDLAALIADMEAGHVDVLIVSGTNPVYSAPNSGFEAALGKVATVISVADRVDETAAKAKFLAAANHTLESWGDSQSRMGVHSLQQPAIQALYDTRDLETCLLTWFAGKNPAFATIAKAPELPAGNRPGANFPTDPGIWYRYLRQHWQTQVFPRASSLASFDRFWTDTLRSGVFIDPAVPPAPMFNPGGALQTLPRELGEARAASAPGDLASKELQLVTTVQMFDGSQANNGHLQELPDPVTKHVWGSYIAVSPKTFKEGGFAEGSQFPTFIPMDGGKGSRWFQGKHVKVTVGDKSLTFPVLMQPGLHDDVIAVPVGYGRTAAGVVGNDVGANAFVFADTAEGVTHLAGLTASAALTGTQEQIAIVQGAQVLDTHRRPVLAQADLESYRENPEAGIHSHPLLPDMWAAHDYPDLKWGMSVDLSKCTGCSACVTACMEENNISVVGRQGILEGREMHWMRIDRYYLLPHEAEVLQESFYDDPNMGPGVPGFGARGEPVVGFAQFMDNPRVVTQPMMCQHCEHAPCETVCPVSATMHSHDGLNQMAYNRCVGTRYCANNCPYKVRRFNWYNYATSDDWSPMKRFYPETQIHARLNNTQPLPRGFNPDVTVRARGVMEKCTFCVQRIRRAGVQRRKEGRDKMQDGDVVPACQQTCPADAIVFGNLADENSAVAKLHHEKRALSALAELGVHSSVAYLTSVNNTKQRAHEKPHADAHDAAEH